jgi:hypothetical protein
MNRFYLFVCDGSPERPVICANGQYYKYSFEPTKGGEGKQELMASFVQE